MKTTSFLEKVLKKLEPQGNIRVRAMFGGYGIYYKEVMFALIAEDTLYFRVDDQNQNEFKKCLPFVYQGQKKPVELPYRTLPEKVLENPQLISQYITSSYEASLRSKKR